MVHRANMPFIDDYLYSHHLSAWQLHKYCKKKLDVDLVKSSPIPRV